MIIGKVVGAMAGFRFGGPIGALAGLALGHALDVWIGKVWSGGSVRTFSTFGSAGAARSQTLFTEDVTVLAAKLSKADGPVNRMEVDAFKSQFHVPPAQMAWVGRIYDQAKTDSNGFEAHAQRLADTFATTPLLLAAVLESLARIARADGAMRPEESMFLERVAGIFRLTGGSARYHRTFDQPQDDARNPYAILGVDRNAPFDEIKAAWRQLTREYHPDNLIAKGLPQENVDLATRKMAEINAAWDRICAERGES